MRIHNIFLQNKRSAIIELHIAPLYKLTNIFNMSKSTRSDFVFSGTHCDYNIIIIVFWYQWLWLNMWAMTHGLYEQYRNNQWWYINIYLIYANILNHTNNDLELSNTFGLRVFERRNDEYMGIQNAYRSDISRQDRIPRALRHVIIII